MIYTVTLNPALDRTLYVDALKPGASNRIRHEARYSGGKGIDVSRALFAMGLPSTALGFVGGFDGKEFEGRLLLDGVACSFTRIAGETRTNIIIQDEPAGTETALLAQGPVVQPSELMDFITRIEALRDIEFLVISGSLPPGLTPEVYRRLLEIGNSKGARTVLDTAGPALKQGLTARPSIIKPNRHELEELAGQELATVAAMAGFCRTLRDRGETTLVSMGEAGIMMVTPRRIVVARPPRVKVRSTVGAGDSAVAGFVCGLANRETVVDALRRAVAAGTAATLTPGTGLARPEDIAELLPRVTVEEVEA
jgi:6-phosphofructokinase 2